MEIIWTRRASESRGWWNDGEVQGGDGFGVLRLGEEEER